MALSIMVLGLHTPTGLTFHLCTWTSALERWWASVRQRQKDLNLERRWSREEADIASPLNRTGANEEASNTVQPPVSSQPVTSTTRTATTQPSGPNRAAPGPTRAPAVTPRAQPAPACAPAVTPRAQPALTRVPAAASRPPGPTATPASRPVGPTRTPGPVRGTPRPNTRPGTSPLAYKIRRVSALRRYCVPVTTIILILASLAVIGILIKVVLDNYYFFCTKSVKFISLDKWCDGTQDCSGNEDEQRCVQRVDFSNGSLVRLTESASLVQMYASGTWSYVCFDGFDAARAKAVCGQLGYSSDPTFTFVSARDLKGPFSTLQLVDNGIQVNPFTGTCSSGNVVSLKCITCGVNHNKQRIIGGQDTSIESSPWQVSLQYMGQHSCGGSILTPRMILCAAHCFQEKQQQVDRWRVQAGRSSLTYIFASQVDEIFIHTMYSLDLKAYDIAILKLKSDLSLSDSIQPICLPGFDISLPDNAALTVTGWGHTVEGGSSLASTLQRVFINLISNSACNAEYFGQVQDSMICAGRLSGGADTCQGDSGGPLVYMGYTSWEQVGIVSWGDGCGRPGKVGVYTEVSAFLSWIYGVMRTEL
ncbi:transmembrane protease serine 4-like [Dendropsophus ebraccatus]|uniref:transmembrane protease serine 4-like n=1 Tax=Dendropsophus ebraccatus TaxID=150705 RepID=UPI003831DCAC